MLDKNMLYRLYITEKKTGPEIARIANVASSQTIYNWLEKYNIPRRDLREAQRCYNPTKDELYQLYIVDELSIDNIQRILNSSESSISKLLNQYNIPKRNNTDKCSGWNKGKHLSEKQKKQLSEIAKKRTGKKSPRYGITLDKKTKQKISNSLKGRFRKHKNPNWKNGGVKKYRTILQGQFEYNEWRSAIFKRDNYTCQECGKPSNGDIQAHHIIPVNKEPDRILDIDNGITLCIKCHRLIKGKELEFAEKYKSIVIQSTP